MSDFKAVVLAAGKGVRMHSELPKVAHQMLGKPLVRWVIDAAHAAGCHEVITVVGHGREVVIPLVEDTTVVIQEERLGTGHAVLMARQELVGMEGSVVVLSGDAPLIRPETIAALARKREAEGAAACVLTMLLRDPSGYGRIIRTEQGSVERIVEQKDCSPEEAAVHECNSGFYCFDAQVLLKTLSKLSNDNAQGEYYLTDCIGICVAEGRKVCALVAEDFTEALGINSPEQLAEAAAFMEQRLA